MKDEVSARLAFGVGRHRRSAEARSFVAGPRLGSLIVLGRAAGQIKYERREALVGRLPTDAEPAADVSPTVTSFDRVAYEDDEPPIGLVSEVAKEVHRTARLGQSCPATFGKMLHSHGQRGARIRRWMHTRGAPAKHGVKIA
jgi:hypothetical protein